MTFRRLGRFAMGIALGGCGWCQSSQPAESKQEPSAGKEMGAGAGTVGVGAAKGAGDVAKGAGKGAVDLATFHPVNAGAAIGKGAARGGKDVVVGTAKGTGKMAKGAGRALKHLF
jgi:hypothetical protein